MPPTNPTQALSSIDDLLERSQRFDVEALAQVHDLFYPELYRYVRFRLDDERLVADVTSDVFLVFLEALARTEGPQHNLRGWLLDTAASLVNNSLSRRERRKASPSRTLTSQEKDLGSEGAGSDAKSDLQGAIRRALAKIPVDQQHLLALRFAERRSLEETLQAASGDEEAIKLLQFRALEALRRGLAEV
jgi:RNA polymerase sigma-70 factor (ECF subfamily)